MRRVGFGFVVCGLVAGLPAANHAHAATSCEGSRSFQWREVPLTQTYPTARTTHDDVLLAYSPAPAELSTLSLRGESGATVWSRAVLGGNDATVMARAGLVLDGSAGEDVLRLWLARDAADCETLEIEAVQGRSGSAIARRSWGRTRVPGDNDPQTVMRSNVTAIETSDFTGDGRDDAIVEVRRYYKTEPFLLAAATVFNDEGRDITPVASRDAVVSIIDGTSGVEAYRRSGTVRGPGPVAGFLERPGGALLVTLFDSSPITGQPSSRTATIEARDHTGAKWTATADVLRDSALFVPTSSGPAFVSFELGMPVDGFTTGNVVASRITVLDTTTGATRWTRGYDHQVVVRPLAGDLLVDDPIEGVAARLRSSSGSTAWSTPHPPDLYAWNRYGEHDHTGDGVLDLLLPGPPSGPVVISGSDGASLPRPTYATGLSRGMWEVDDISGDGADDVIIPLGVSAVGGPGAQSSVLLSAYSGADGGLLWAVPHTADYGLDIISGPVTVSTRNDVVVHNLGISVSVFDGTDGSQLWSRALP